MEEVGHHTFVHLQQHLQTVPAVDTAWAEVGLGMLAAELGILHPALGMNLPNYRKKNPYICHLQYLDGNFFNELFCDLSFLLENRNIHFHRFIQTALGYFGF